MLSAIRCRTAAGSEVRSVGRISRSLLLGPGLTAESTDGFASVRSAILRRMSDKLGRAFEGCADDGFDAPATVEGLSTPAFGPGVGTDAD